MFFRSVLAYVRESVEGNGRSFLILLNFSGEPQQVNIKDLGTTTRIILATDMQRTGELALANFTLAPNQGLILQL